MADYISQFTGGEIDRRLAKVSELEAGKQDKLVSGENIKTVGGQSLLGDGNIPLTDQEAVKFTPQSLTDAQKAQALANIGAASEDEVAALADQKYEGPYESAAALPTASASTMGAIYLVGPDGNGEYDRYVTKVDGSTYTWGSLGKTSIDLSNYATKAEVGELEAELYDIETIDGMQIATITNKSISADGTLTGHPNYRACSIPNNGYNRISGHGSSYRDYLVLAFYNSSTPDASSFISGIAETTNYTDLSFDEVIPAGTITIIVCYSTQSPATTAVATLYKKTKISDRIEQEISDLQDGVGDLEQSVTESEQAVAVMRETSDLLIDEELPTIHPVSDFSLDGYYNNGDSGRTSGYGYTSLPLINVREGQVIYWHKWSQDQAIKEAGAVWCYDNDGLPYDGGSNARTSFKNLTTQDYENGEFSFVIPSGCSQIGISASFGSYPVQEGANIQIGDLEISFTDKMKELVNLAVEQNEETGDKSAKYYLKGNSNIVYSPAKKLGIIAGGQSNIDGRNSYSDLPAGFVNPNAKVRFCNNINGTFADFQVTDGGSNNDWSFDAIVYDLLTKSAYGNQSEIYVMKKSMGGTSIDKDGATNYHWTADYEYLTSETYSLLRTFEKTIRKGEETQGANFEIKAFLWHQGEGDADTEAVALRYYDNLKNMLAYVRGIVGNPRLDFFCGNLSENNNANPYIGIINDAYAQLASEDPYFHCVDMRNAALEDSWHFNYQWSIYFGQKVYDLMIDAGIITGTKINPSEPS